MILVINIGITLQQRLMFETPIFVRAIKGEISRGVFKSKTIVEIVAIVSFVNTVKFLLLVIHFRITHI